MPHDPKFTHVYIYFFFFLSLPFAFRIYFFASERMCAEQIAEVAHYLEIPGIPGSASFEALSVCVCVYVIGGCVQKYTHNRSKLTTWIAYVSIKNPHVLNLFVSRLRLCDGVVFAQDFSRLDLKLKRATNVESGCAINSRRYVEFKCRRKKSYKRRLWLLAGEWGCSFHWNVALWRIHEMYSIRSSGSEGIRANVGSNTLNAEMHTEMSVIRITANVSFILTHFMLLQMKGKHQTQGNTQMAPIDASAHTLTTPMNVFAVAAPCVVLDRLKKILIDFCSSRFRFEMYSFFFFLFVHGASVVGIIENSKQKEFLLRSEAHKRCVRAIDKLSYVFFVYIQFICSYFEPGGPALEISRTLHARDSAWRASYTHKTKKRKKKTRKYLFRAKLCRCWLFGFECGSPIIGIYSAGVA